MLTLLEEELMRRLDETAGLGLVRRTSGVIAAAGGGLAIGDLSGDQAHFNHEFRAFTGLTPTRYLEVRRRFRREHPGHAMDGWPLPAD